MDKGMLYLFVSLQPTSAVCKLCRGSRGPRCVSLCPRRPISARSCFFAGCVESLSPYKKRVMMVHPDEKWIPQIAVSMGE